MRWLAAFFVVVSLVADAPAQTLRYELGVRLRAFEETWEKASTEGKKRALPIVEKVTNQFFSFQLGEVGRTLDDARQTLMADKPRTIEQQWADSLYAEPETRLLDTEAKELKIKIQSFYPVKADKPKGLAMRLTLGQLQPVEVPIAKLPAEAVIPLPAPPDGLMQSDLGLRVEVLAESQILSSKLLGVSRVSGAGGGFAAVAKLLEVGKPLLAKDSLELATLLDRAELLKDLASGTVLETDLPAAKLFTEAQDIVAIAQTKKPYFTPNRAGQFWLSVPVEKSRTPCRLFVPKNLETKKPVPLVVALHGAGGSENLFFEGYGAGQIVKECEKRGWLLLAPRLGLGFSGPGLNVAAIVDKLAERYPIDTKAVFVVGHSMGAAATIDAVQKFPGRIAAAAALGGGGRLRKENLKAFEELPTFVGVGTADRLALTGARALGKTLAESGAKQLTTKEYAGVEHMVIVREALPDAFALFDKNAKR